MSIEEKDLPSMISSPPAPRNHVTGRDEGRTMPDLGFELLGPVRASRGHAELDLGSPQQKAVLAALLLAHGRHVGVHTLIDALWGDDAPRTAANTIRTYVSRLRRCLEPEPGQPDQAVIKLAGDGYALRLGSAVLDLDIFEQLTEEARAAWAGHETARAAGLFRAALAMWPGTPLAGITGPFAEAQRARLIELWVSATEEKVAADIDSDGHVAAIMGLRELLAAYPLREKLVELLMLALYRSGRQADALAAFDDFRLLLGNELGIDPGPSLRDMRQRILRADGSLTGCQQEEPQPEQARQRRHALRPTAYVLSTLPTALADFAGRNDELSAVTDALTDASDRAPAVAVSGMPGIGKTALAVQAALAVADRFPDGQLFADLGDRDDVAGTARTLRGLLGTLGVTVMPETTSGLAAALRAELAGRRMVIVLDDVRNSAQVRALLPAPSGCAVIVTSRHALLDMPGVRRVELAALTPGESLDLLRRLVGTERVRAEARAARLLVEACCCHPLAIRTAAMRLATRPAWQIATMARHVRAEMRDPAAICPDRDVAEAPFASAYDRLSQEEAAILRQAALGDRPEISVAGTAAALDQPERVTRRLLETLAELHLVEAGQLPGEFRCHPLIRSYAWRKVITAGGSDARSAIPAITA
jgi:DNA-binding SARP family transcriptional activator